ncbi:MAG: hypothetical protein IJ120_10475 [Solobacterium sp.]|nr:hypothetical protein [Solobacterium sp.]
MPFIRARINTPLSEAQEVKLKELLGKAIEDVPGKSEEYLLLVFEDNGRMWLRGSNDQPAAYIEASIFGNETHAGYTAFTADVTEAFHTVLGISAENVYIHFDDISAWGVSGQYIDRRMFR